MIQESIWPKDPRTDAKYNILERYLEAWFPIMSSQFDKKLIYLDGFAAPGIVFGELQCQVKSYIDKI